MNLSWKSLMLGLFLGFSLFGMYAFKNLQSETEKGFVVVVYTKNSIEITLGNSKHESIELRSGMYKQNDNSLVSVLNRFGGEGYRLVSSNSPNVGEVYYVLQR